MGNGNKTNTGTDSEANTELNDPNLDFNDSTIIYGGGIDLEYDEMIESSDIWGDLTDSKLTFTTFMQADTIPFDLNGTPEKIHTFIKIEYPNGGLERKIIDKINKQLQWAISGKNTQRTIQDEAILLIRNIALQHIAIINQNQESHHARYISNEDYQISINISVIRSYKNYLAMVVHKDTQRKDSQLTYLNFDLETGEVFTLKNILSNQSQEILLFNKNINERTSIIYDRSNNDIHFPTPTQFYLAPGFISLNYQYHELSPLTEGTQAIYIPYSEIRNQLNLNNRLLLQSTNITQIDNFE